MNRNVEIANTIIQQLGHSTARMGLMIGAHTFTAGENNVTFKFKARAKNGSNCVRITLNPSDTYTVEFISLRGMSIKTKGSNEGMYAEDLKTLFERETGLYLSIR